MDLQAIVAIAMVVSAVILLMVGFPGGALVEVGVIGCTAAGHGDVEQVAAGVLPEHRVRGFGGDALG